jgi:hypothetical protein
MSISKIILATSILLIHSGIRAQTIRFEKYEMVAVGVSASKVKIMGKEGLRVVKDSTIKTFDEPTFMKIKGLDFKNGTIEVKVLSKL